MSCPGHAAPFLEHPLIPPHPLRPPTGSWLPDEADPRSRPETSVAALRAALAAVGRPVMAVQVGREVGFVQAGRAVLGDVAKGGALPLLGYVPAVMPGDLGDTSFRADHGVEAAYVVGEMANGITSVELVVAAAKAGLLGVFGAAGLPVSKVREAIVRLQGELPDRPWGINLIHSPDDPRLEADLVGLLLEQQVRLASASAYLDLTLPVVRYRVAGIHRDASGNVVLPNRLMAKVSRVEVARRFLEPPPERFLAELVGSGFLTPAQAAMAATVPMADDVTAEADSGGHTDNRPLVLILPAIAALRDDVVRAHAYDRRVRVGAAGGLGTPAAVAAAFAMGAAYVVTGSVNQATLEAGTCDRVRQLLAEAAPTDVAMAPAADMFELGAKVQVLSRGTLFAVRAARLLEIYRAHDSLEGLPKAVREEVEGKVLRASFAEAWEGCRAFFAERDPSQIERAEREPRHKMALVFRSYLGQASRWANAGVPERALDYQIWCGPAMGAFNEWTRGSFLERWDERRVAVIARNLLVGAAVITRAAALRGQLGDLPAEVDRFSPRPEASLAGLLGSCSAPAAVSPGPARASTPTGEPIAIVGMGAMFPDAPDLRSFWRLLRTGHDAVRDIPGSHWSLADYHDPDPAAPDKTYARRGAFLPTYPFDPTEFGVPPSILEATDTSQLLGLVVARMAMEDAGYGDGRAWDRSRASVILGVTGTQELVISLGARLGHPRWKRALEDAGVDAETAADVVERIGRSYVGWQESSFPGLLGNVVAGRIANRLDLGGTNCVLDAACASSLSAVHLAVLELRAKTSDLVLTGGVDCLNDIFMHMCFSKTPALSASGDVRPFSDKADGTLLGEGLGMVVLKRLSDAERDGDRVYAVILGVGTSSDGRAKSVYAPLPTGQARALRAAYAQAGVRPRDVTLLEAHGTGTKAGDVAEVEALRAVFREDSPDPAWCALGAVKSQIGHTKAAAGSAGVIKAALALHHKVVPPTLKVDRPNPALELEASPFALPPVAMPWLARGRGPRVAGVSSFGFGGSNYHVVLGEASAERGEPAWDGSVELVALSASDAASLVQAAEALLALGAEEFAAATRRARETFDASHAHRLVAVVPAGVDLAGLLRPAILRVASGAGERFRLAGAAGGTVHHGSGPAQGQLAFLFPGQGSQHVGMLRELACVFPELLASVEGSPEVARAIYPLPTFDEAEAGRRDALLTRTDMAQQGLGLVARGLCDVLVRRFGLRPSMVAGHSYGELPALYAAGVLDAEGLQAASRARGEAMLGDGRERGTMLAVLAPLLDVDALVADGRLDLVVANRNGPEQAVLSGARGEIERAEKACQERGLRATRLQVGAAFHSPLVAPAAEGFRASLGGVAWGRASLSVLAGSTAEPYPSAADDARDLLAAQIARPVRFVDVVEKLYATGVRTFVEVGPKGVLTRLVQRILDGRPVTSLAVDAGGRLGGIHDLAEVLASVAAAGHPVMLGAWERGEPAARPLRKPKMSVALSGANYRSPIPALPPRAMTPVAAAPPRSLTSAAAPRELLAAQEEGLRALQAMQEQTARVHQVFLEGQRAAQLGLQALLGQPVQLPAMPALAALPLPDPIRTPAASPQVAIAPPPSSRAAASPAIDVTAALLAVVSQATGYPEETLSLDMGMEADLGIDSIKRVEILSLLSKRIPGAPPVNPEKLGTLRTLGDVARFMGSAPRSSVDVPAAQAPVQVEHREAPAAAPPRAVLLEVVGQLTGYPAETLSLEMDMEADLGIDSIKRVEILSVLSKRIPGAPAVNPEKLSKLRTLGQVLAFVSDGPTTVAAAASPAAPNGHAVKPSAPQAPTSSSVSLHRRSVVAVAAPLSEATGRGIPQGPTLVAGGDRPFAEALTRAFAEVGRDARIVGYGEGVEGPVSTLVLVAPGDAGEVAEGEQALKGALALARTLGSRLRGAAGILATVSRRDGTFGLASRVTATSDLGGGLAGLAKTAAHEWPEVSCRAIDASAAWSPDVAARAVVAELAQAGPREVGLGPAGRVTLALHREDAPPAAVGRGLEGVVVVTGGARGVTAECARALAARTGVTLLLLGRTHATQPEPAWAAGVETESALKRAYLDQAPAGARPTPRVAGEACRGVLAAREVRASLRALQEAGVRAEYRAVDVRDAEAVAAAIADVRSSVGPIVGLVHGAGVVRDRRIEDKRDEDFDDVLDPKLAGLRALLSATKGDDLRCIVLFASATGRFGRRGQSDYAVANQALVSMAQAEAARRPGCRVTAIDWGPWEGGMVTPALQREFARENIAIIPLPAGAAAMCDEALAAPGGPVEIVLGAGFGSEQPAGWVLAKVERLDASALPVLRDHGLAGKAVLPLALSMDWMSEAARRVTGRSVASLHDVRVFRGVTVGTEPCDVSVWVHPEAANGRNGHGRGGQSRLQVELRTAGGQVAVRGVVAVGEPDALPEPMPSPAGLGPAALPVDEIYRQQLFHGPSLQAIEAVDGLGESGVVVRVRPHPTSERLLGGPGHAWNLDPLVTDGALQALILWCRHQLGAPSLPSRLHALHVYRPWAVSSLRVVAKVQAVDGLVVRSDVDFVDVATGALVGRMEGYICTASSSLDRAFSGGSTTPGAPPPA